MLKLEKLYIFRNQQENLFSLCFKLISFQRHIKRMMDNNSSLNIIICKIYHHQLVLVKCVYYHHPPNNHQQLPLHNNRSLHLYHPFRPQIPHLVHLLKKSHLHFFIVTHPKNQCSREVK